MSKLIRDLIGNSRIGDALDELMKKAVLIDKEDLVDEVVLLQSRFKILENNIRSGLINHSEESAEKQRIQRNILVLERELESKNTTKIKISSPREVEKLDENDIFNIVLSASVIIEIDKIEERFYQSEKTTSEEKAIARLYKFSKYSHSSINISKRVFYFLMDVSLMAKGNLTIETAFIIRSLVRSYSQHFDEIDKKREEVEIIINQCITIGDSLIYYSLRDTKKFRIACYGFFILKYLYLKSKKRDLIEICDRILKVYNSIESVLQKNISDESKAAIKLILIYKEDLEVEGVSSPKIPMDLLKFMD